MKTQTLLKGYLFLLVIALLFSCNKNVKHEKIQVAENPSENYEVLSKPINIKIPMTHYTLEKLWLRESADISSSIVALLPKRTNFNIIETGETETIDGITASWIKIETQYGYAGWCFSDYVKQIGSESNEFPDLPLILEEVDYSHIIKHDNFTIKFATQTADVKIYEDDICIMEKDYISQDTFIINNNTAIFDRNGMFVFFELYTKKETAIEPTPLNYMNFSSSKTDNIFYASSYGGDILRFNYSESLVDKEIDSYIDWSIFVRAFPDSAVDKIDEYKKWGVFTAAFSDGRILSIGTDDQQAPYYTNDLEIRLYDKFGKKINSSKIFLQGHGRITTDYYFDNIDNILFIYNRTEDDTTNVYRFDNNSIYEQKMPEFGHIINRIEYNNKVFFATYISFYDKKIYFYNTKLELEATMYVELSEYHEIANVELINNTIKVYEYLPGK